MKLGKSEFFFLLYLLGLTQSWILDLLTIHFSPHNPIHGFDFLLNSCSAYCDQQFAQTVNSNLTSEEKERNYNPFHFNHKLQLRSLAELA